MEIESINHKALRRFVETGKPKGLPGDLVDRLFKMINFIIDAETLDELSTPPNYGLHPPTGDRAGTWAMTVTRNWRMTFSLNEQDAIADLDLEDYH
ncbi:type II toxin-antitoxin system RelE/ParE family toxin [Sphingopyxis sp. SE2]|uniref:type II toxin-antitoxin system RelE/ParE family toxin n=1 Tax=unclassified Sphingopyxis TaxID=2614943 RepID=UPI00050FB27B|nr:MULTISPECIES: type II toxin-antitoxin system RelE/ParE family toxin [unclassified Sphingopyxis]KGB53635.1 Plasmid maintenance system killer [Sphingopyxis sp. LC363]MDT7527916.1 type II toxin-antitoxin system RelE/ParE family toxin [Sphingopyxis sp. SE2]